MKTVWPSGKTHLLFALILTGVVSAADSSAAMITPNLNTFTLKNTTADGSVTLLPGGLSFDLTGGNTGSGLPGFSDFTSTAPTAGTVQFSYSYAALDTPGFDFAGYLLGNTRFLLADTDGQSGSASFTTTIGQVYGFYVGTQDNTGEPGVLSVTLSGPASTVPEPSEYVLVLSGVAALVLVRRNRCSSGNRGELRS